MAPAEMSFAECNRCAAHVRVWHVHTEGPTPVRAGPDAAIARSDRRFTCPRCGAEQLLPIAGVYVIYDRAERSVRYVGHSSNVPRRLEWWRRPGGRFEDVSRYRGVQLVASDAVPDVEWFAAGDSPADA